MRRRELVGLLGTLAAVPLMVRAQQPKALPRVAYLDGRPTNAWVAGLLEGLNSLGYVDGKNVRLIRKEVAISTIDATRQAILEIADQVDVLVVGGTVGGVAAKSATSTIPVVFISVGAPVDIGLVKSLAHPGGNITGVSFEATSETYAKRLQILKEIMPKASRVAVLGAKDDPNVRFAMASLTESASAMQVTLTTFSLPSKEDLPAVFDDMKRGGMEALLVVAGGMTYGSSQTIADLALANRLPSLHGFRETVAAGGLISLGPDLVALARQSAHLVDKIIKGEKPADIPVEQPERYTMAINLKTAQVLGLTIPPALLARADEVIE
ncbi:ABC transporter substrate-binding protein [Bradyrhizobium commune]|uniref:ABC transporter substrate-binding protein n=1 Tax=Bradyrhizobium commune TaxID=83627 RepID=A0A7S9D1U3_9BRAD|nr:ABC transporter substrate-binding protein [Bradyrhizobium commune]QPF89648.1 ABC transporter substrate-binding protein [Bradyrhizobium commune]